jgi:hypothetical protein
VKRAVLAVALAACGTTGGNVISFDVVAQGTGIPPMDSAFGWHVVLSRATLHIGAAYLNIAKPISGQQTTSCILPGNYTAQELSSLDVDVLSTTPQQFPEPGTGTDDKVQTGEIWLTGGDVNSDTDATMIAELAGTATRAAQVINFTAAVTIGAGNRGARPTPGLPSLHPICKQRIVSPIFVDVQPHNGGTLVIQVDPFQWFSNVDFTKLPPDGVFPDDNANDASLNLFSALRASSTYQLLFE